MIRKLHACGMPIDSLAEAHGCSHATIYRILQLNKKKQPPSKLDQISALIAEGKIQEARQKLMDLENIDQQITYGG